ncbi:hypothetical protein SAMN04489712_13255 [Thermomonospora echinospora]|uniref:Uncharacterized protein n=1 Tax=Thermomonospora echinospora TaxID=1992 RepID=A0A1H6E4H2_9ACTN|nr:hypothetical protein [Thermomonospora echinospora]SEG92201.1 hypothetical protein SAMN04489712_13255 [Thermomonospora echinospora]
MPDRRSGRHTGRAWDAPRETDTRRAQVWALAQVLKAHGYGVEVAESEPLLVVAVSSGSPVQVRCDYRQDCGGEPWFFLTGGGPLAAADGDHLQDAVVAVKGALARRG